MSHATIPASAATPPTSTTGTQGTSTLRRPRSRNRAVTSAPGRVGGSGRTAGGRVAERDVAGAVRAWGRRGTAPRLDAVRGLPSLGAAPEAPPARRDVREPLRVVVRIGALAAGG